jgi:chromosome segregation ATPase
MNREIELVEELRETFVNEFEKMIAAYDRDVKVNQARGDIAGSVADLYRVLGQYTYASGLGESTYAKQVQEQLREQLAYDRVNAQLRRDELAAAASDFANIAAVYGANTEKYQNAQATYYGLAQQSNEAEAKILRDQIAIDQIEVDRLNAIKSKFDSYDSINQAITSASKATTELFKTIGSAVNSPEMRREMTRQLQRQQNTTAIRQSEFDTYQAEMQRVANAFGTNSNQYRDVQSQLSSIGQQLIESQNAEAQLKNAINELNFTFSQYVIENIKAFVSKLSALAQLGEKRGTNPALGYLMDEGLYIDQIKYNNKLITKYDEARLARIKQISDEINAGTLQVGSERYQELYGHLTEIEGAMIDIFSSNEDIAKSLRTLRWKPYEELKRNLDNVIADYKHLQGFIRQDDMYNRDTGEFTDRGWANIALIGGDIDEQSAKAAAAKTAIQKLNDEYANGTINLETYNEEIDNNIKLIQDATAAIFDDQEALANMKITQWQKESDAINEVIELRKNALSSKKAYYDYDK